MGSQSATAAGGDGVRAGRGPAVAFRPRGQPFLPPAVATAATCGSPCDGFAGTVA